MDQEGENEMDCATVSENKHDTAGFLNALFPPDVLEPQERAVVNIDVNRGLIPWTPGTARRFVGDGQHAPGKTKLYFCVSTVGNPADPAEPLRRKLDHLRRAFAFVLDDIGTKSTAPSLEPSYKVITSIKSGAANYQWGYLLEPFDVSTQEGRQYYDACCLAAIEAGHSDPGMRSASRLARVPGSLHDSGYVASLEFLDPDRVWTLPELMSQMGLDPQRIIDEGRIKSAVLEDSELAAPDSLLDFLTEQRMVVDPTPADSWVTIECPWAGTHTDGKTTAFYSPLDLGKKGRQFKCFHGHCKDKHIGMLTQWAADSGGPRIGVTPTQSDLQTLAKVLGAVGVPEPLREAPEDLDALDEYVYLSNQNKWLLPATGEVSSAETIQRTVAHLLPVNSKGVALNWWNLWELRPHKTIVFDTAWDPRFAQGPIEIEGTVFWNTNTHVNMPARYDDAVAQAMEDHVLKMFGYDGWYLIEWMAYQVQNHGAKLPWAPLLYGMQGDGKTLLARALGSCLEADRVRIISNEILKSPYTGYIEGASLVILEEIRASGSNRYAVLDRLKEVVANERVSVVEKYRAAKTIPNFANVIACTNHGDALPLTDEDRRWMVLESRFVTAQDLLDAGRDAEYFTRLYDWAFDGELMRGWLQSYDLAGFDHKGRAPKTEARQQMVEAAKDDDDHLLMETIARAGAVGVSESVVMITKLRELLQSTPLANKNVGYILQRHGWKAQKLKIDGVTYNIRYDVRKFPGDWSAVLEAVKNALFDHDEKIRQASKVPRI